MGYYTVHELTIIGDGHAMDHAEGIDLLAGSAGLFEGEPMKWYDHEKDMRAYSKGHPDIIFKLYGEGEESEDMWVEFYKNGKMQHCKAKITFDDFDEYKLI